MLAHSTIKVGAPAAVEGRGIDAVLIPQLSGPEKILSAYLHFKIVFKKGLLTQQTWDIK